MLCAGSCNSAIAQLISRQALTARGIIIPPIFGWNAGAMRIVYVLTTLGMGGAERQVIALAELMAGRGHAVALLVLMPPVAEEWATALEVKRLEMRKTPVSILRGLARGLRFLHDFRPDLVHSHTFPANMVARALKVVWPRPPLISTIHNVYEGGWARMLAYRLTWPLSRLTTAVSHAAADRYVRIKAVPGRKCMVVTNGIDTAEFRPDAERRALVRAEMGAGDEFIWLTAGRIAPAKDYPNLLRAFSRVAAADRTARLWVAGEGDVDDLADLILLARDLGLDRRVRWLGLRRDMAALHDAADGFVLGSAWEGMPLALGEAMAMEKPIIATDVGGVRELVGDAGMIVPAQTAEALGEAMLVLMRSTAEKRAALGRAARERIAKIFSMDAKADEWEALYLSVLSGER
jgi:glycosyltransferase involved in cell wall biosynthesis